MVDDIALVEEKIETLRQQMIEMAELKGSLSDTSVISLSQQLDHWLVQLQRNKMATTS